jgi:hypothetical protein
MGNNVGLTNGCCDEITIFTKVGNGTTVAIMLAGHANIFTHVGDGFSAALMIGGTANTIANATENPLPI